MCGNINGYVIFTHYVTDDSTSMIGHGSI